MLSKLKLSPAQIHHIRGEDQAADAASQWKDDLRRSFKPSDVQFPRFDMRLGERSALLPAAQP
ncbi:MAG: hypothetical protein JO121_12385 [Deltaproteobacteria bacterium]|nr:hypothetical protein [Deltaproteobacteria bacterium]